MVWNRKQIKGGIQLKNKRLLVAVITGAILGIFCIIGAQSRFGGDLSNSYLFGFWFNRLLMGIVIGLLLPLKNVKLLLVRGVVVGLIISFAFYSATEFKDLLGFLVGAGYGMIIEYVSYKLK